jgi:hypothetical protein
VEESREAHRNDECEQAHHRDQQREHTTSSSHGGTGWSSSEGTHERSMK